MEFFLYNQQLLDDFIDITIKKRGYKLPNLSVWSCMYKIMDILDREHPQALEAIEKYMKHEVNHGL